MKQQIRAFSSKIISESIYKKISGAETKTREQEIAESRKKHVLESVKGTGIFH